MKSAPFLSTLALAALAAAVPAAHAGILYSLSGDSQAIGGTFSLTFETPTFVSASTTLSDVPGLIGCTIFGVACESAQWLFEPRNHPLGADHTTFIIWAGSAGLSPSVDPAALLAVGTYPTQMSDITLTVTQTAPVPEPATAWMALGALAAAGWRTGRRRVGQLAAKQ